MNTNLVTYLHQLAEAPQAHPEAAALLASKMREALEVTNEMAKLVIRYQGLLDRCEMPNADAAELRGALGELAANVALRVAVLPSLPDGPARAALSTLSRTDKGYALEFTVQREPETGLRESRHYVPPPGSEPVDFEPRNAHIWPGGVIPGSRGPISRDEAVSIARRAAMAHKTRGLGPGGAPHYLAGASQPGWQPHEWVIDAVVAAAARRPDEFQRPPLTRDAALALGRRHAPAEIIDDDPHIIDGQKVRRRVEPWMIDAIVEASR